MFIDATRVFATFALSALITPAAFATTAVDALIEREMRRYGIVGMSVGVREGNRIVHEKAYGLASVELGVPTRRDTVYQLSSTTKIFTGTALIALFAAKDLSLDSTAATHLPELPQSWRDVTVRQLLSHLSGLPDVVNIEASGADEAIAILGRAAVEAPAGSRWRYNQTNYMLARRIIERVSGKTFEDYLEAAIFRPAGMRSTTFGDRLDVVPNRATSYQGSDGVLRVRDFRFSRYNNGAAGYNSNVPDLLRFDAALRSGAIMPADRVAEMWKPARLADGSETHYGLGWAVERVAGHRSAGHEGGGMTTFRRFIDDDITVVLLTNGARDRWDVEDLVERIAAQWKPDIRAAQDRLADRLLDLIEAGSHDVARRTYDEWIRDNASVDSERAMNTLGYRLLRRRMSADAITVFRWNTTRYPTSANAFDSLGEALLAAGSSTEALRAYERALELDPNMESAKKAVEKLRGAINP